jgi:membrane protein
VLARIVAQVRWFFAQIVAQFRTHGLLNSAAALTYATLFAVVPLMTVSYTMLSVFPTFAALGHEIQEYVFENFVPTGGSVVQESLTNFAYQARQLTYAGFAMLLVTAYLMLITIEKAFNEIWQVAESRRGVQRFVTYWAVLTCGPPLVVGGLLVSSYLMSLPLVSGVDAAGMQSLLGYLPPLLSATGFTVLFFAVPNCRVPFRHAVVGGILTMFFFEAAKRLFAAVVVNMNMQIIYGTFAVVPLFLTWLYLVWLLVLSGAIVVRTLGLERRDTISDGAPLLVQCARVLAYLRAAHLEGRIVTHAELHAAVRLSDDERIAVFEVLTDMKLIANVDNDQVALGRDLRTVTLLDLYRHLPVGLDTERLRAVIDLPNLTGPLLDHARFGAEHLAIDLDSVLGTAATGAVA